ncbi:hypothetical protein F5B17DRAFT_393785 [Nemania serpens]|nr:hypothetical protein F5B17DRAFT_393785 [Nemania serpens]
MPHASATEGSRQPGWLSCWTGLPAPVMYDTAVVTLPYTCVVVQSQSQLQVPTMLCYAAIFSCACIDSGIIAVPFIIAHTRTDVSHSTVLYT